MAMSMANFHPTVIIVGFSIKIIYTGMHGIPDPHLYTAVFEDQVTMGFFLHSTGLNILIPYYMVSANIFITCINRLD